MRGRWRRRRPDPARPDLTQADPAQADPAQRDPAQPHPAQPHPAQADPAQAQAFAAVVRQACLRLGCTIESFDHDQIRLYGRITGLVGLREVRQSCLPLPRERWLAVVEAHLAALARAAEEALPLRDLALAGPALRSRLSAADSVPEASVSRPLAPGLTEVLVALSRVGGVATVPARVAAGWGVAEEELFERARRQVLDDGLLTRRTLDLGGVQVMVLQDASTFTATHVLWLPTYLDTSDDGALVALPTRTVVLAHALVDSSALDAVQALLVNAARLHESGPQSLSPQLYWWRPGPSLTALPAQLGQQRVNFFPPGDFVAVLDRLPPHPA